MASGGEEQEQHSNPGGIHRDARVLLPVGLRGFDDNTERLVGRAVRLLSDGRIRNQDLRVGEADLPCYTSRGGH